MMHPWNDLTGKKFGKLTVLRYDHTNKDRVNFYECKCDCGNIIIARGVFMRKGITLSCGCPVEKPVAKESSVPVKIGQKVRFDPFRHITGFASDVHRGRDVRGIVVYINEPHKWFSVVYGNPKLRTSFHFCDIGHGVQVIK